MPLYEKHKNILTYLRNNGPVYDEDGHAHFVLLNAMKKMGMFDGDTDSMTKHLQTLDTYGCIFQKREGKVVTEIAFLSDSAPASLSLTDRVTLLEAEIEALKSKLKLIGG